MVMTRPTVVISGASGDLGSRLVPLLADFNVVGLDWKAPTAKAAFRFIQMNLEREDCCREMMLLLRETRASTFVHLASVNARNHGESMDPDRMWQINVAGIARVLEAITEANREEMLVKKFIFPSSTLVYGPDRSVEAGEETEPASELPLAVKQQLEAERVIRKRGTGLRACSIYVLRAPAFAGASSHNHLVNAFRPGRKGKPRLFPLPWGSRALENRVQFVHVDDMARLISYITHKSEPEPQRLTFLNVTGRGEAISYQKCLEIAHAKRLPVPGANALAMLLRYRWNRGTASIPPELVPFLAGESLVSSTRLRKFLGHDYEDVIHHTIADAFADSFSPAAEPASLSSAVSR
jgi:nucleoside-diphosphate-sugar epimerase